MRSVGRLVISRSLLLVAYDVTDPRRLAAARDAVSGWASGGQKSVFECLARPAERRALSAEMLGSIDITEDRLAVFAIRSSASRTLGLGRVSRDQPVIWVG